MGTSERIQRRPRPDPAPTGNVVSLRDVLTPQVRRLFTKRMAPHGGSPACWLWPLRQRNADGYGVLTYKEEGTGRWRHPRAHRLAYLLLVGPLPPGLEVRHRCDVPACFNPTHLEVGIQRDNVNDRVRRGRDRRGQRHHKAILTDEEATELRLRFWWGERVRDLALLYGVHYTTAYNLCHGWQRRAIHMNASKENVERALQALQILGAAIHPDQRKVLAEHFTLVEQVLQAAQRKLPHESSFARSNRPRRP